MVGGLLGVDHDEFARLAAAAAPGAGGLVLLPYLDGERTPNRPDATGAFARPDLRRDRADLARAAVEGLLCSLADAVDALGVTPTRVLMIGGASRNPAVQQLAPTCSAFRSTCRNPASTWRSAPPGRPPGRSPARRNHRPGRPLPSQRFEGEPDTEVREQYAAFRDATAGWG